MTIADLIVLYVEDDRMSRTVMQVLLTEVLAVNKLFVFENSADFLTRVQALDQQPHLIFLDIQVQPLDGYQMLAILREQPAYQQTTIIALTANVMAHDVDQLKAAGFDGLIGKPIMEDVFPQLIDMIVNGESVWYIP